MSTYALSVCCCDRADLVVCAHHSCQVRSFGGNLEARFSRASSNVQLLYRKDRYFNTRDVRLKDLYPMIEWYKQHRREFLFVGHGGQDGDGSSSLSGDSSSASMRTKIRDLRENMVADVVCRLRELKPSESVAMGANLVMDQGPRHRAAVEATDFDGVLLHELVMQDNPKDWMVVNLWDQHAENKFVARLLAHRGVVEIRGIVVSLNGLSNRLLANTTPQTQFCFIDAASADKDAQEIDTGLAIEHKPPGAASSVFGSLDELESSPSLDGLVVLDNIRIEQLHLGQHFGSPSRVLPQFAQLLVESYCSVCNDALPELQLDAIPPLYGPCKKHCRVRNGKKERLWRYRRFHMVVRDAHQQWLQLEVEHTAMLELLGNIEAEMLIHPHVQGQPPPFHVQCAVASLLNAVVGDATQTFRAEVHCDQGGSRGGDAVRGNGIDASQTLSPQRKVFTVVSLVPTPAQRFAI